jgi:hypothetical protein
MTLFSTVFVLKKTTLIKIKTKINSLMKQKLFTIVIFASMLVSLASCDPFGSNNRRTTQPTQQPPAEVDGWAPVYSSSGTDITTIKSLPPQNIDKGGKIYIKGDTLYEVEAGKGIHVILIKQPQNPQKLAFISVTGAQELAIKNNMLYTNNMNDLVVIDISKIDSVKTIDRVTSIFHLVDPYYPPGTGYYECIDSKKGTVVGWEQKVLAYPKCRK